jgi:hypothetical protein
MSGCQVAAALSLSRFHGLTGMTARTRPLFGPSRCGSPASSGDFRETAKRREGVMPYLPALAESTRTSGRDIHY